MCRPADSTGTGLLIGSFGGALHTVDLRTDKSPLASFRRNDASVNALLPAANGSDSFWAASGDGACSLWSTTSDSKTVPRIVSELSGVEYQSIYDIARYPIAGAGSSTSEVLYTASVGTIRAYGPIQTLPNPFPLATGKSTAALAAAAGKLASAVKASPK